MTRETPPKSNGSDGKVSLLQAMAVVMIAALAGLGAVYAMARSVDNNQGHVRDTAVKVPDETRLAQSPATTAPAATAPEKATAPATTAPENKPAALPAGPGANPLSVGEMAAFVFKKSPEALPEFTFVDAAGKERSLKDWRGKVVLLNLWATWCIPCRKEMPGLDRLQAELGSDKFEVVALSVDRTGIEGAKKFMSGIKVEKLGIFVDPTVRATATLKVIGLPGTLLLDREGREIGRLIGPAEWDSADAKALIKAALK